MKEEDKVAEKKAVRSLVQLSRIHGWNHRVDLSYKEREILVEVLRQAGFPVKEVVRGFIKVECLGADQKPTGEKKEINTVCQYRALAPDGTTDLCATGWLDTLVRHIRDAQTSMREHEEQRLVRDVERLVRNKRLGLCTVPDGTTSGSGKEILLPSLG